MSSKKEPDLMDFWQKHNRNVQLKRSADAAVDAARAKKEQAFQAKLDREANDRHRAEMEELAKEEKEANDRHRAEMREMARKVKEANDRHRAEMKEMARKEKEAKEFTKQQQFKLYDISCQVKELSKQDTVLSRIRLFYETQAEFEKIVHDAIEDLKYRKLYTQVETSLKKEEDNIVQKYQDELSTYQRFSELKKRAEQFDNSCIISNLEELREAEKLLDEIIKMAEETPELAINTQAIQSSIELFVLGTAKLKWFLELLESNYIASPEQRRTLLSSYYGVNEQFILSAEWESISPVEMSAEDIGPFCNFAFEYIHRDPSYTDAVLEIMESIDDPAAEQTVERIKGEQQKRIAEEKARKIEEKQSKKQYKKMVKELAEQEDKTNKKEKDKDNAASCLGCLGIIIIIAGISCAMENHIIWACIVFIIGVFIIRGPFCYFLNKQKQKNNETNKE